MMIVFIVEAAYPDFDVFDELETDFVIRVGYKCCEVVDVVRWLVKVFNRDGVWITKADKILKYKSVIFIKPAPKYRC